MDELEAQLAAVEDKITIEQYKAQNQLKKEQVVEFLTHTIRQSPRLLIKNLIQKIVVYDDRFEIYYNYLNRMPPKTDDIGDKSIAETPPNTCSDISKDSSPRKRRGFCLSFFVVTPFRRKRTGRNAGCSRA